MNIFRKVGDALMGRGPVFADLDYWTLKQVRVTVLIPAYNEVAHIGATIRSLKKQTRLPDRILVVDDCSSDGTGVLARQLGVDVIRTLSNTGTKAQAQNYALQFIRSAVVVTIDADTTLAVDALERIIRPLSDPAVASVCGFVIPQRIKTVWERMRYIQYLWGISVIKETQSNWGTPLVSSGCFSAYRTGVLKSFGGFPYRSMVEDMDLTWLQLEQGYRVVLVPEARCYPRDPHNFRTYYNQLSRWLRGFLQVIRLHKWSMFKRFGLIFNVAWGFAEGSLYPIIALLAIFNAFTKPTALRLFLLFTLINMGIVTFFSVLEARKEGKAWLALTSLPFYFLFSPVNAYIFWESLVLEWFLGRSLTEWKKGH